MDGAADGAGVSGRADSLEYRHTATATCTAGEDRRREIVPRRFAGGGHMIGTGAIFQPVGGDSIDEIEDRAAQVGGRRRCAVLIVHDAHDVAGFTQAHHRRHEVRAETAVEPRRAQHQRGRIGIAYGHLTLEFRPPIDIDGSCRIVFAIGPPARAVEHVVGRDMDDWN